MTFLLLLFIPLLLIDLYTPHIIRKTTVFGVSIPEPFIDDIQLKAFKQAYTLRIALFQIPMILFVYIFSLMFRSVDEVYFIGGGLFLYLTISMLVYLTFHYKVVAYKKAQGWENDIKVVRVSAFETKFEKKNRPFPHILFIPTFFITFGLIIWLAKIFPTLPTVIPTHWGFDGQPDAWSNKSIISVFSLPGILLFTQALLYGTSYGTFNASGQLKAQDPAKSHEREHEMRKLTVFFMAFTNVLITLFFCWIEVQSIFSILQQDQTLSMSISLPAFLLITFGAVFWYMKRAKRLNMQFKDEHSLESAPSDDEHWKWGIFYFNRDNPDFFVEKKYGVGWTTNFAHPGTWIFFILVLVVPLIPLFFL